MMMETTEIMMGALLHVLLNLVGLVLEEATQLLILAP